MCACWNFDHWKQSAIRRDCEFLISEAGFVSAEIWTRKSQKRGEITSRDIDVCFHKISGVINRSRLSPPQTAR